MRAHPGDICVERGVNYPFVACALFHMYILPVMNTLYGLRLIHDIALYAWL